MDDRTKQRVALPLSGEKAAHQGADAPRSPISVDPNATLEERVIAVLRTVYDPEIPVDIYELGLIYDLKVDPSGAVAIRMTLTSPMCPVAEALPAEVRSKVEAVPGVTSAKVDLVWEPPWDKSRMSEEAQLALGLFE
jgi:FeS assembly SUF system protein